MIQVTPFERLGKFRNDWLDATHHFSFGSYYDPARTGVGDLLVWNDDTIRPQRGFDPHGHRDMEIITYIRGGAITHRDHLGNDGRTVAGDVQVMSAGRGIQHAEYNLEAEPTRLFQIWIRPAVSGIAPRWETRGFPGAERAGVLVALASGRAQDAAGEALRIHQDAAILGAHLPAGRSVTHALPNGRQAYLVADRGAVLVNGRRAEPRDGIAVTGETQLAIEAVDDAELVLADLA